MTHDELKSALRVFGFGERATLREIKARYRELAKRHHPDGGDSEETEEIYRVNEANRVILEYVESYRFCFSEREYLEQYPEEHLRRRLMADPLWGRAERFRL